MQLNQTHLQRCVDLDRLHPNCLAGRPPYGVDPQRYLTSVLAKIGTTPSEELDQFLPDTWKADDAAEPTPTN